MCVGGGGVQVSVEIRKRERERERERERINGFHIMTLLNISRSTIQFTSLRHRLCVEMKVKIRYLLASYLKLQIDKHF